MDIFQSFLHLSQIDSIPMELDEIEGFKCHTYIKSTEGKYIFCNKTQATSFGYSSGNDVTGMTDYDLFCTEEAGTIHNNDKMVLHTNKPLIFTETGTLLGTTGIATSMKTILKNRQQKVIGVIGVSILHETEIHDCLENNYNLSKRHLECLFYLVKGFTVKEISNALALSPRTIEHYVETIKLKLNCTRRSDIFSKALLIPQIKMKLLRCL